MHLFNAYNLEQKVNFPTYVHHGQLKSCLDLAATNIADMEVASSAPLGRSDHIVLIGRFVISSDRGTRTDKNTTPHQYWCWSKADLAGLRKELANETWADILQCQNAETAWIRWRAKVVCITSKFIPQRSIKHLRRQPKPWITAHLQAEIREKHRLYSRFKRSHSDQDWLAFKQQRNTVSHLLRTAKSAYVADLPLLDDLTEQDEPRCHPPRLHRLLRCLLKQKSADVPDLVSSDGSLASTDVQRATVLNDFFISEARQSAAATPLPPICTPMANTVLTEITTSTNEVLRLLRSLDIRKASGEDGIPTRLLKLCAEQLTPCLTHLFNVSLATGKLPQDWKSAVVSPIHKRDSRAQPGNYRPISLLSTTSKILEKIVADRLYQHVNSYLPVCQSGFRRGDGTTLQLVRLVHEIAHAMDKGEFVLMCFYDLSKAFDRVWHPGLIAKLDHLGVRGQALNWLTGYLNGRRQRVRVIATRLGQKSLPEYRRDPSLDPSCT